MWACLITRHTIIYKLSFSELVDPCVIYHPILCLSSLQIYLQLGLASGQRPLYQCLYSSSLILILRFFYLCLIKKLQRALIENTYVLNQQIFGSFQQATTALNIACTFYFYSLINYTQYNNPTFAICQCG